MRVEKRAGDTRDIDGVGGQVVRSGADTLGVFIPMRGWSSNVPELLKQNPMKRVILMDDDDIRRTLAGEIGLDELLRAKVNELSLRSEPFIAARDVLASRNQAGEMQDLA